jgi:uncharacterized protein YidB (DUF937 family)
MGLLDSVLGAVAAANRPTQGDAESGLGSLIGMLANNPQLIQVITSMLANDGGQGGLGGLMAKFQQAGLGDAMNSWVGTGQNQAISGDQLSNALGPDTLSNIAAQLGMNSQDVAGQLSQVLPGLIDQLTPQGQAPEQGFGNANDLFGMLGGLLQK